jgi:hypothetical protein
MHLDKIRKRVETLEKVKRVEGMKVSIVQKGSLNLVFWGQTVVKALRGVTLDDL